MIRRLLSFPKAVAFPKAVGVAAAPFSSGKTSSDEVFDSPFHASNSNTAPRSKEFYDSVQSDCMRFNSYSKAVTLLAPSVVNLRTSSGVYSSGIVVNQASYSATNSSGIMLTGSDKIITTSPKIITCAHAVLDMEKLGAKDFPQWVHGKYSNGKTFIGTIGSDMYDLTYDIALLEIVGLSDFLPAAKFGSWCDVSLGDLIFSVGTPLGCTDSVSMGIVSCVDRHSSELRFGENFKLEKYLQTDCVLHEGNSGGPVANLKGEVIGLNCSKHPNLGVGFAIPIHRVVELMEKKRWLG